MFISLQNIEIFSWLNGEFFIKTYRAATATVGMDNTKYELTWLLSYSSQKNWQNQRGGRANNCGKIYIFSVGCSGLSPVTKIWISLALARCGGGEPSNLTGIRSRVGLACCTINCGIIRLFGRFGDFGDRCSGVGGSTSIRIFVAKDAGGRFGIGLSNGGVFLFGIGTSAMLASFSFTMTFTKSPLF